MAPTTTFRATIAWCSTLAGLVPHGIALILWLQPTATLAAGVQTKS